MASARSFVALFMCALLMLHFSAASPATRKLYMVNKCGYEIYVGMQGNPLPDELTGFLLPANEEIPITVDANMLAARVWPRLGCSWRQVAGQSRFICDSGDCGSAANNWGVQCKGVGGQPPATLAEFSLGRMDQHKTDYYDLSNVDGHSVRVSIQPTGNFTPIENWGGLPEFNCGSPDCIFDQSTCPIELKARSGTVDLCYSLCSAVQNPTQRATSAFLQNIYASDELRTLVCCACWAQGDPPGCGAEICCDACTPGQDPLTCCVNAENCCGCWNKNSVRCCTPNDPTIDRRPKGHGGICRVEDWPLVPSGVYQGQRFDQIYKSQCRKAYSWQFDDLSSTYQCQDADYIITFCGGSDHPVTPSTPTQGPVRRSSSSSSSSSTASAPVSNDPTCLVTREGNLHITNIDKVAGGPVKCVNGPSPIGRMVAGDAVTPTLDWTPADPNGCLAGQCKIMFFKCGPNANDCCASAPFLSQISCTKQTAGGQVNESGGSSSPSTGAMVAIGGGVLGCAVAGAAAYWVMRRKKAAAEDSVYHLGASPSRETPLAGAN